MSQESNNADIIIYGNIFTSDKSNPYAKALAISKNKIIYVGNAEEVKKYQCESTEILDYKDNLVTYGFTEGHTHYSTAWYNELYIINLQGYDHQEYLKQIKAYKSLYPNKTTYKGKGWVSVVYDKGGPYAKDLDEIFPDTPVLIAENYFHSLWVNSKTMELCGIDKNTKDPIGGKIHRYSDGTPSGRFDDLASNLIYDKISFYSPNLDEFSNAVLEAQKQLLTFGITTMQDAWLNFDENTLLYEAYTKLDDENKLIINFKGAYAIQDNEDINKAVEKIKKLSDAARKEKKFELNCIKIFMDGTTELRTAWVVEPYLVDKNLYGLNRFKPEKLVDVINIANDKGLDVHVHSIGDRASVETVNAFDKSLNGKERKGIRNVITHLQSFPFDLIKKCSDMNIIMNTGQFWCFVETEFQELYIKLLGEERAEHMYPNKAFIDGGCHLSFGGDAATVNKEVYPFEGIHCVVNRTSPVEDTRPLWIEQAITVEQALMAYTYEGAYQLHMENDHGMIKEGYVADIIVIDKDITKCDKNDIHKAKVIRTIVDGKTVYKCDE